jgi:hypothetical protein
MIPHRRLNAGNCESGVRYRVAACRRRLRLNRTTSQLDSRSTFRRVPIAVRLEALPRRDSFQKEIGRSEFEGSTRQEAEST